MTFVKYCDREHSLFQPYGDRSSFHAPAINVATAKSTTAANSTLKTRSSLSSWVIPYLTATHRTRIGKWPTLAPDAAQTFSPPGKVIPLRHNGQRSHYRLEHHELD